VFGRLGVVCVMLWWVVGVLCWVGCWWLSMFGCGVGFVSVCVCVVDVWCCGCLCCVFGCWLLCVFVLWCVFVCGVMGSLLMVLWVWCLFVVCCCS
jgi:hypothetical protein